MNFVEAKRIEVIEVTTREGCGGKAHCARTHEHDIVRHVRTYLSMDGTVLAVTDDATLKGVPETTP